MKLQYNKKGLVDFAAPIFASEQQREKIIEFFKTNFPECKILFDVKEKDRFVNIKPRTIKHWEAEELYLLMQPISSEEICEKTQRNIMSVNMKRSGFEPEFRAWLKKKGYQFPGTKENIQDYLNDARENK